MKTAEIANNTVRTIGSLVKAVLLSGLSSCGDGARKGSLVIMGNGPSLRQTIDTHRDWLESHDLLAVNFAARTPEFRELRPCLYVLADGHFFGGAGSDPNVADLWQRLRDTDWPMTLWVPVKYKEQAGKLLTGARCVRLKFFNLTPLEGFEAVVYPMMDRGLGMPRPRNVMIPSIMCGIREGYKEIILVGADHTWTKTLDVDDENFVVSVQPHFYADNKEEHARVRAAYAGLHLHDVLGSMTVAFRSYWQLAGYARHKGVRIVNATPGSMIDAFERKTIEL